MPIVVAVVPMSIVWIQSSLLSYLVVNRDGMAGALIRELVDKRWKKVDGDPPSDVK